MRFRSWAWSPWSVPATLVVGLALSGCGSSSSGGSIGPNVTAAHDTAAYLDTLASTAATDGYFDRNSLLSYPIAVFGEGVLPASVSVSVDGSATPYQAAVVELVQQTAGASPTPSDSAFYLFAYTGTSVTELVFLAIVAPDTLDNWADLSDSIANYNFTNGAQSATVTPGGATTSCNTLTTLSNASDMLLNSTCKYGKASISFDVTFAPDPPINPNSTYVLNATTVPYVRIVLPAGTGGTDHAIRKLSQHGRILLGH
jgi:hypothetical protein